MPTPDFTNTALFPTYDALPETTTPAPDNEQDEDWFLLAQVKDDMTIAKPTLVLLDRTSDPFALIFDGLDPGALDFKALGLRKGCTAVVPRARRTPPREEGKRGFVSVPRGAAATVRAIPAGLERVLAVGERLRAGVGEGCEGCGKVEGALSRCEGCRGVRYCGKECQVKGWGEGGHKGECKVIKAIRGIWGEE
ncbi:hypothetical protein B0T18DRAFT_443005 [Schizothecium vesticola]|uniref:MYND-type domain-containing protein n=1 Tax=Schizothecium vesticola TaxID=314040 RepID=A0AA40FBJ8_9PEZI|nr:hypothetical protein B0T18DRAFT_443005 [Schizothecium vesticola]